MERSFFRNALWNILGFSVSLASGVLLSPYIIRKLGPEGYGVWALAFALVDYLWLSDMGFRSAVLKYSAHYMARREVDKINEVLNTALACFAPVAVLLLAVVGVGAFQAPLYFRIPAAYQEPFGVLLLAVGWSWAFGLMNNVFRAALEGFQEYGVISRITIIMTAMRAAAVFLLVYSGHGLREMGYAVVAAQAFGYIATFVGFRRVFPEFRLSPGLVSRLMLKQMAGYGVHTFVATIASQLQQQGPTLLIGRMLSVAAVGFYSLPMRLLNVLMDAVPQVGMVSSARSAELSARGDFAGVARLGAQTNRYCFLVFLFPLLFLSIYAAPLFRLWVGPAFAAESAPLMMALAAGAAFAIAGQQNTSAILYGLGAHQHFAKGLLVEAMAGLALMAVAIPHYGLAGVAVVSAVMMIAVRGILTPWLICRRLDISFVEYMAGIYSWPLALAVPVLGLVWALDAAGVDGSSWSELIALGLVLAPVYYGLGFFTALLPEHRLAVTEWAGARLRRGRARVGT
ncbi:MAG: oligosaccharide flippase family protein [Bryobacterales bacterium]|nr:oligosaccharide flippase family protein [Bryobacterales bacterium]